MIFESSYRRKALQSLESEKREIQQEMKEEITQFRQRSHLVKSKGSSLLRHFLRHKKSTF